jgi:purine-binding chemotaxis protein CheW
MKYCIPKGGEDARCLPSVVGNPVRNRGARLLRQGQKRRRWNEQPSIAGLAPRKTWPDAASQAAGTAAGTADLIQFISFASARPVRRDIMAVREIKGWSDITHLPNQPDYVRGVLNLRGVIVPIIDLRCRFGQGLTEATVLHVVIIVQIDQQLVGLLADRVSDIISFDHSKIKPVPKVAQSERLNFLSGIVTIDDAMIALIELSNLLTQPVEVSTGKASPH